MVMGIYPARAMQKLRATRLDVADLTANALVRSFLVAYSNRGENEVSALLVIAPFIAVGLILFAVILLSSE